MIIYWLCRLCLTLPTAAQVVHHWTQVLRGFGTAEALQVDAGGNAWVAGGTGTFGVVVLMKFDAQGVQQWTRQRGDGTAYALQVDRVGNAWVAGYTLGSLDGNTNAGWADIFLMKFDAQGVHQWTRQRGGERSDYARALQVDAKGNVLIAGETQSSLDGHSNAGDRDMFLMKFDAQGVHQWTQQRGGATLNRAWALQVDAKGNALVAGSTQDSLDGCHNAGDLDAFLMKFDAQGVHEWTRLYGGEYTDEARALQVDEAGNSWVAGATANALGDGATNAGSLDIFLMKCNAQGVPQWITQRGGKKSDEAEALQVDGAGQAWVAGNTWSSLDGHSHAGRNDVFLMKFDAQGAHQWTRQRGSPSDDVLNALKVDGNGNCWLAGWTNPGLDAHNYGGAFLMKFLAGDDCSQATCPAGYARSPSQSGGDITCCVLSSASTSTWTSSTMVTMASTRIRTTPSTKTSTSITGTRSSTAALTRTASTTASTRTASTTASTRTASTTASTRTASTTASTRTESTTALTRTASTTASTRTASTTASTRTASTTASTRTESTTALTRTASTTASTRTASTTASSRTASTTASTRTASTTASTRTESTTASTRTESTTASTRTESTRTISITASTSSASATSSTTTSTSTTSLRIATTSRSSTLSSTSAEAQLLAFTGSQLEVELQESTTTAVDLETLTKPWMSNAQLIDLGLNTAGAGTSNEDDSTGLLVAAVVAAVVLPLLTACLCAALGIWCYRTKLRQLQGAEAEVPNPLAMLPPLARSVKPLIFSWDSRMTAEWPRGKVQKLSVGEAAFELSGRQFQFRPGQVRHFAWEDGTVQTVQSIQKNVVWWRTQHPHPAWQRFRWVCTPKCQVGNHHDMELTDSEGDDYRCASCSRFRAAGKHWCCKHHQAHVCPVCAELPPEMPTLGLAATYLVDVFPPFARSATADQNPNFYDICPKLAHGSAGMGYNRTCPRDGRPHCSIVDALEDAYSGKVTHFVSWCWAYSLNSVVSAIKRWLHKSNEDAQNVFLWMCFFCNNQYRIKEEAAQTGSDELREIFESHLVEAGHMLVLLDTIVAPTYVTRAWCIFESYVCIAQEIPMNIILPDVAENFFRETMCTGRIDVLSGAVSALNVRHARAGSEKDEDLIKQIILNTTGFDAVNHAVRSRLIDQLTNLFRELLTPQPS